MNKLLIAVALCAALAACKKEEAAPAAEPAAQPDAAAAAAVSDDAAAAPVNSGLPQVCEDYLNRAKACVNKSGGDAAATAFQQGIDQTKAQWETMTANTAALEQACTMANDQFAQTAAMLKCE